MTKISTTISTFIKTEIMHDPDAADLPTDLNLLAEGVLDSLGLQLLVVFLEENYAISIGDDDLVPENFETIDAVENLVNRLQP